jgi:hypothetical protein
MRILLILLLLLLLPCSFAVCQDESEDPHAMCEMAIEEFVEVGDDCHQQRGGTTLPAKKRAEDLKKELDDADRSLLTFGENEWMDECVAYADGSMTHGNTAYGEATNWTHQANLKFGAGQALCAAGDHEGAVGKFSWATSDLFTSLMLQYDAQAYYEAAEANYDNALYYLWWASNSNECLECQHKDSLCNCDPDNQPNHPDEPEEPEEPEEP